MVVKKLLYYCSQNWQKRVIQEKNIDIYSIPILWNWEGWKIDI